MCKFILFSMSVFVLILSNTALFAREFDMPGLYQIMPAEVQMSPDELDSLIQTNMDIYHIPGLTACIVRYGRVLWSNSYGLADIANEIPMTEDKVFRICSISKTVTCAAIM